MRIDFSNSHKVFTHIISGSSFSNFFRVVADNRFRIAPRFWPRLLFSVPIILLNIPFVIAEKILYNKKIRNTQVNNPVFILGYPRSGTTYLVYLLSKDPQFAFSKMYECMGPHVMFTFGHVLRRIAKRVLPEKRPMDNLELGPDVPKEEEFALANMGLESMANALFFPRRFSEYFDRFVRFTGNKKERDNFSRNIMLLFKKLTLKNNGKRLILKSPFNTGRVKLLLELFPDAKFIHIHRHPYEVYASNQKLYASVLPEIAFHTITAEQMQEHILYTYKATMEAYFTESNLLNKNQLFEMDYETFSREPEKYLKAAYEQLELGGFDEALPYIKKEIQHYSDYKANKHNYDEGMKKMIKEKLGFVMDRYNYNS